MAALGLSCDSWDLVPRPGIEPRPPVLGVWRLSHWTSRKVPHSCILAWKIPWTEELLGYSSWGHKESDTTEQLSTHAAHGSAEAVWLVSERFFSSKGLPCGSAGKESACDVGRPGSIPGLGKSPGEGRGYPLQDPGLENSMDCIIHGVPKSGHD